MQLGVNCSGNVQIGGLTRLNDPFREGFDELRHFALCRCGDIEVMKS